MVWLLDMEVLLCYHFCMDTQGFIEKARAVHGGRYDYSRVQYRNNRTKVIIGCPEHGWFGQVPQSHLKGFGCRKCAAKKRAKSQIESTKKRLLNRFRQVHGDRYEYDMGSFSGMERCMRIRCSKHGWFEQPAKHHADGHGCARCAHEQAAARRRDEVDSFIEKASIVHGGTYIYTDVEYVSSHEKVAIICREHGRFMQTPNKHLMGRGCPKCARQALSILKQATTAEFIEKARAVHGDRYDYSRVDYKGWQSLVEIVCPEHGSFMQKAGVHLMGCGCRECGLRSSDGEREVAEYVESLGFGVERNTKKVIPPYEVDIFVPERGLCIEYNGNYWHSENAGRGRWYHARKVDAAIQAGKRIIMIREDEWRLKRPIVESIIAHALGVHERSIGARKCVLADVPTRDFREFMEANHLQGANGATVKLGLYYQGELIAAAGFTEFRSRNELARFACRAGYSVPGALGRLVKAYGKPVMSYCDRRLFTGHGYIKSGFRHIRNTCPDFVYVNAKGHVLSRYMAQKAKLRKLLDGFDPNKSELQNMRANGWLRVWGAGHMVMQYIP